MIKFSKPYEDLAIAWKSNDFFRARIKLTFLYFFIITGILLIFSGILHWQIEENIKQQTLHITMSTEKLTDIATQEFPGQRIIKSEMEKENNKILFNVRFDNNQEIKIDPVTGKIVKDQEKYEDFEAQLVSDIEEVLLILNVFILILTSFLSYFLAGKTLKPIEEKMKQQKQFITDAAHELKNPLSAIQASSESILRNKKITDAESREVFGEVLEESGRLITLTKQLLQLGNTKKNSERESIHAKKVIEKTIKKITPLAKEKNIFIDSSLEEVILEISEKDLETIVFNLLHNAIKFSHQDNKIVVSLTKKGKISVQDFGIGIEKKDLSFIFNRFYKADQARTFNKESGSGLGLSIVKKIVDSYNGKIDVDSKKGQYTKIEIIF